jgi:hypothetical protein
VTIRELIDALTEIERQHGPDVPVCHHDDWDFFVVERVWFCASSDNPSDEPDFVAIEGDTIQPVQLPGGPYHEESK